MEKYVTFHEKPIWRGGYYVPSRGFYLGKYELAYCENHKEYLVFREGWEVGLATKAFLEAEEEFFKPKIKNEKEI